MQIPPPSDRVSPRYEIHIDSCIHSSRYWNIIPLAHCHTDIQPCSYFVLHGQIHNTQWMLSMYIVPPDRYEGAILLFSSAANPRLSVKFGWLVQMWYGDPLYSQWCYGHTNQEYSSYNAPHHSSGTDRWNLYTIFDFDDYFITYLVPFPLPSIFTTPFRPISFSNCVVFDLPNGEYTQKRAENQSYFFTIDFQNVFCHKI